MQDRNPFLSLQQIHEKIFNRPAYNSGEFFTLSELYKIKTNLNINLPAGGDINSMTFTLVSPEVVSSPKVDSQNNPTCLPNDVSKSSNSGYVFGCYPVLEN